MADMNEFQSNKVRMSGAWTVYNQKLFVKLAKSFGMNTAFSYNNTFST